ncbi:MAG: glycosyltransferase, partial [Microthrixaceae bacterium]|nr:glycosyltransferase [Microthrixaceae bacterium]
MNILITNRTMSIRNGAELYVRDLALELLAQGHRPMIYTSEVGVVGRELIDLTVPVTDNLDDIGVRPDIIHGQTYITAMAALTYFDDVPMVNMCHGWRPWTEAPLIHPNVVGYAAVDDATHDRLAMQHGIGEDRISVVHNFVDLDRFRPTAEPNEELGRILLFSNYVRKGSPYYRAAHEAAEQLDARLDVVGSNVGTATTAPEQMLGDYDVVLAQGRSALEAMAVGASVMICSSRAFGPLV